jgi:hypothetical protein
MPLMRLLGLRTDSEGQGARKTASVQDGPATTSATGRTELMRRAASSRKSRPVWPPTFSKKIDHVGSRRRSHVPSAARRLPRHALVMTASSTMSRRQKHDRRDAALLRQLLGARSVSDNLDAVDRAQRPASAPPPPPSMGSDANARAERVARDRDGTQRAARSHAVESRGPLKEPTTSIDGDNEHRTVSNSRTCRSGNRTGEACRLRR